MKKVLIVDDDRATSAGMADVAVVVHRNATAIHPHFWGFEGFKR